MKIKAVVFDYGKVICFPPSEEAGDELAAAAQAKPNELEAMRWKYRADYDLGLIDGPEYYRRILKGMGKNPGEEQLKKLTEIDLNSWKRIDQKTVGLMEDIKKAGLLLGILSNMPFDFLEAARKTIPVFSLPHIGIFSCELGVSKPDEEIYQRLLLELKCAAEEVVFFDDMPENIEKARELNIHALLWENAGRARRSLTMLGVKI